MALDISKIRAQFPALQREAIFFDNPAGTQVPNQVLDRIRQYMVEMNANTHGVFSTSQKSDQLIDETRAAAAAFLGAARPDEVIFGPNMTSLTFNLSRSLALRLNPGDEIVVTRMDHDANITPWTMIAADRGCTVRWVDFDVETGTLDLRSFEKALENKPKIVAIGYASNALGTINPVKKMTQMAHAVGSLVFVDAVQYAPHGIVDVEEIGCDFLAASAYKFFSVHAGILYGRYDLLAELKAYKVRPAYDLPPDKFETGTKNHEGIAGILGAFEYLEWIAAEFGMPYQEKYASQSGRRKSFLQAMTAIRAYEYEISRKMLAVLKDIPGLRIYGLNDERRIEERVPTFAINLEGQHPTAVAKKLAEHEIYVWDGNYYALAVTERLGVEESGGMVRIGPVHYNSLDEIQRFGEVLAAIAKD